MSKELWAKECIGCTEQEVVEAVTRAGGEARVSKRDGVAQICTRDYRHERVNMDVENGVVVAIHFG